MSNLFSKKSLAYLIFFLIITSYFLGFFFNENSAGGGGYNGDISWILKNINIFQNNNLFEAIFHDELFGNRTPLIYIINDFLNPYFYDYEKYRTVVFILSLAGCVFLYFGLKMRYNNTSLILILILSSIILLSPYYRTSAYWALNENYGLISSIISLVLLNYFLYEQEKKKWHKYLYLTIFFSSLTIYFDQKFLIIPIIAFFYIMFSNINYKYKIYSLITYLLFSIPYFILIIKWEGLVPPLTQLENPRPITNIARIKELYLINFGYSSTLIAFYLLPLLFFKDQNFYQVIKRFFLAKISYLYIFIALSYVLYLYLNFDFKKFTVDEYWVGYGYIHKLSVILFDQIKYREIFTYFSFVISWIVIWMFLEKNYKDFFIISFFFILSLFIWPIVQEYFDPIIIILSLLIFKTKLQINYFNSFLLVFYFSAFLIVANVYYYYTI